MSAGSDVVVRRMRPGEAEDLVRLVVGVFEKVSVAKNTIDLFGPLNSYPWEEAKGDAVRDDISSADVVLVCLVGGALAAMATIKYDRKYSIGQIRHVAVAKGHQRRGLGRRMVNEALARMREDGIRYASIEALEQNGAAESLYRAEGFVEVARKIMMFRPL